MPLRKSLPLLIVVAFLAASVEPSHGASPSNILLIMADDIGVEAFGCYGGESYQTPNIDRLAATGVRFTSCHSQPLCTPSRVKILTGKSNVRNYMAFSVLAKGEATFATILRDEGYATAVAGKWQLMGSSHYKDFRVGIGQTPADAGFDHYSLWQVGELGPRYWGPRIERDGALTEYPDDVYGPEVSVGALESFMEANQDRAFLAYYPMTLVHDPFLPTVLSDDPSAPKGKEHFADMVRTMDHNVGRLVRKLSQLGLRESTLIVFVGDNGTPRGIRTQQNGREVAGGKRKTLDTGTHVPLVVSQPGTVQTGAVCEDLIDFSDFLPTLLEAANKPLPDGMQIDGRSFHPQLRGQAGDPREWIYCYYNPRPGKKAFPEVRFARDHRFKLYGSGDLFDVRADSEERDPIAVGTGGEAAEVARAKLSGALESMPKTSPMLRMK